MLGLPFPPISGSGIPHTYTQGSVNASNSVVYYSGVDKVRGVPRRRVLLARWGSNVWAERVPDHGDKTEQAPSGIFE